MDAKINLTGLMEKKDGQKLIFVCPFFSFNLIEGLIYN